MTYNVFGGTINPIFSINVHPTFRYRRLRFFVTLIYYLCNSLFYSSSLTLGSVPVGVWFHIVRSI